MFRAVTVRILAIAACGGLLAGSAHALTLGPARSATLIGRPFEATVPVTLDAPQEDPPCTSADLFYGESRSAGSPSVRWEAASPTQGVVRIRSATPVDEPMVTLYLRVGCQQQTSTRRYVLLSEPPPVDEPAARAPLALPAVRAGSRPTQAPVAPPVASARKLQSAPSTAPSTARATARATAPAVARAERAHRGAAGTRARATGPAARTGLPVARRPHLQLDSPDLAVERDPTLRMSPQLGLPPAAPQDRAALSAWWQAAQAGPERMAQDMQRLQVLQRELEALRTVTRQNADQIAQLRMQAAQESQGRSTATLLAAGFAALLLALLAWLGWRRHHLHRMERLGRWFEAHGAPPDLPGPPQPAAGAAAGSAPPADVAAAAPPVPAPSAPAPAPARAPAPGWGGEEFQGSRGGPVRMVGVEELIDVHDKADFFLSIGETEQALALLDAHVHDEVDTGALAWMDLLELHHSLGRRDDYDRLRAEFRQRFMAQVPEFEHFDEPAPSLEAYSRALSRIVALWPSPQVQDVIAQSIFRQPGAAGMEPFSLEAYRELVLLYHIARELIPQREAAQATRFPDTSLQPLRGVPPMQVSLPAALDASLDEPPPRNDTPMGDQPPLHHEPLHDEPLHDEPLLRDEEFLLLPPASARLGVDIDLDEPPPERTDLQALDFDISAFEPAAEPGK